jgi:hypothetical protein
MAGHRTIDLELKKDKPGNVYRFIDAWEAVPSTHAEAQDVHYLFLVGIFQWGSDRSVPVRACSIAMQYSNEIGKRVDVAQPAHILSVDADRVLAAFQQFVSRHVEASKAVLTNPGRIVKVGDGNAQHATEDEQP